MLLPLKKIKFTRDLYSNILTFYVMALYFRTLYKTKLRQVYKNA